MVHIIATFKSKAGHAQELFPILQKLARMSRAESGVLRYEVFHLPESDEFIFFEQYTNEAAFQAHKNSRHVAVAFARATPFMQGELCVRNAAMLSDEVG